VIFHYTNGQARILALAVAISGCLSAAAGTQVERVSLAGDGSQANLDSYEAAVSDDGSIVAFRSSATNLVTTDTNGWGDIFVRDFNAGITEMVSIRPDGEPFGFGPIHRPSISDDGQLVVFTPRHPNGRSVTLLRDRVAGSSEYLMLDESDGGNPTGPSRGRLNAAISGNGQFVVFDSLSTLGGLFEVDLRPIDDDNNATFDVFIHDVATDPPPQVERLSRDSTGDEGRGESIEPGVSDGGRWVAFHSYADDLVAGDVNEHEDVFVRDRDTDITELISANPSGAPGNDDSIQAAISGNGQFVAFRSRATDLVAGDTNGRWDIFVRDRTAGSTARVSVSGSGAQADHHSTDPDLSDDGRFVVFRSLASNLVPGDTNNRADVFVHDRTTGETAIVSKPATGESNGTSHAPAISGDGAWIVFESDATNLVAGDTNSARDVFRAPNPLAGGAGVAAVGETP